MSLPNPQERLRRQDDHAVVDGTVGSCSGVGTTEVGVVVVGGNDDLLTVEGTVAGIGLAGLDELVADVPFGVETVLRLGREPVSPNFPGKVQYLNGEVHDSCDLAVCLDVVRVNGGLGRGVLRAVGGVVR